MQDQKVRLELEKKLAASSQKFAEAAKLSAELKALAAKHESDVATRQQVLVQVESERAALEIEKARANLPSPSPSPSLAP